MSRVIEVSNLKKQYGATEAVKGISFSVEKGSLFAFLGTNGAGKSTTIEILCTLLEKTSGDVIIDGHQLGTIKGNTEIRKAIGIVFQQSILDALLTVKENILHRGRFYQLTKQQLKENYSFVCDYLHIEDIADKKYGQLSGGQKRRADIARAIIHRPQILFLDEPTTGLDPQTRQFVWSAIERLRKETNVTVFLTTHYMEEATVADKIIIINKGEIVAQGTPNELKEQYASDQLIVSFTSEQAAVEASRQYSFVQRGDVYILNIPNTLEAIPIIQSLQASLSSFEVVKGSLDSVFIEINEEKVK